MTALENLEIPIRRPSLQHTVDFRNKLVDAIMHRFALSGEDGSPTRKFAVNIFDTKEYIIASLLDPRVKTAPFESKMKTQPWLGLQLICFHLIRFSSRDSVGRNSDER